MKVFNQLKAPLAITMWDFSWLERHFPSGDYEDWDTILDELVERGYNAVRIDAYPHLLAIDPNKTWKLNTLWENCDWGVQLPCEVQIQPNLNTFIKKCADRQIYVGLSTWFREDEDNHRLFILDGKEHGEIWVKTLQSIEEAGLLDNILFVDLCNEWTGNWAAFFKGMNNQMGNWTHDASISWMQEAIAEIRKSYPQMPLTFSMMSGFKNEQWKTVDLSFFDFLEPHLWMTTFSNFYQRIGYFDTDTAYSSDGFRKVQKYARRLYMKNPDFWKAELKKGIDIMTEWSKWSKLPLITTECWGIVDYKDGPLLEWDWVIDLCEYGTQQAAQSGRWAGIATSNFCAPQFKGMWNEKAWHQEQTRIIRSSNMP